jgi:hypothetical protein
MMAKSQNPQDIMKASRMQEYEGVVQLLKDSARKLEKLDAGILNLSGQELQSRLRTGSSALQSEYQTFLLRANVARQVMSAVFAGGGAPTDQQFQRAAKILAPSMSVRAQLNALEDASSMLSTPSVSTSWDWQYTPDQGPSTQRQGLSESDIFPDTYAATQTYNPDRPGFQGGYNLKELVNQPPAPQTVEPIINRNPAIPSLSDWTTFQDLMDAGQPVGGPPVSSPPMFTPTGPPPDPSWGRGSRNWDSMWNAPQVRGSQPSFPPLPEMPPLSGIAGLPVGPLPPAGISGPRFNAQDQSAFFDQNPVPPLAPSQSQLLVDQLRQPVNTATETLTQPAEAGGPTPPARPSLFTAGGLPAVRPEQPGETAIIRSVQDAQRQINEGRGALEIQPPTVGGGSKDLLNFAGGRTVQDAVEDSWLTSGPGGGRKSFPTLPFEPGSEGYFGPGSKGYDEAIHGKNVLGFGGVGQNVEIKDPSGNVIKPLEPVTPLTPMQLLMQKALTPPSLKSQLIPAGIAAGTSLLGAWLGSRSANKAAEIQDRQFQEQMGILREDRARSRAVEDWEIQVAHEREKQIGGPLKQAQAAAIPGYAKHFGLKFDPQKFVTPDLDPRFTGEMPKTAADMAPPGYVLDASGNPVLASNQQKGGGILSKLLKYGLPAAAIAMPALGAAGVPGFGWASNLAGKLFGLGGGGAAPAVTGAAGGMFGPTAGYGAATGAASKIAMLTKAAKTATAVNNLRNAFGQNAVGYDASNRLGYASQNPFQNVQFGQSGLAPTRPFGTFSDPLGSYSQTWDQSDPATQSLSSLYFPKSFSPFQT